MRYESLTSVDFVLVDARTDFKNIGPILFSSLAALFQHFQYHFVFLCSSAKEADAIDQLGDDCGQDLFFHGEVLNSTDEFETLIALAKLMIVPNASWESVYMSCKTLKSNTALLRLLSKGAHYYAQGTSSNAFVETTLSQTLSSLSKG